MHVHAMKKKLFIANIVLLLIAELQLNRHQHCAIILYVSVLHYTNCMIDIHDKHVYISNIHGPYISISAKYLRQKTDFRIPCNLTCMHSVST